MNYIIMLMLVFIISFQAFGQQMILDQEFGAQGTLKETIGGYSTYVYSSTIDEEGRLLIAGFVSDIKVPGINMGFIARYSTQGEPDLTFGEKGVAMIQTDGQSRIYDVVAHKGFVVFSGIIYRTPTNQAELYTGRLTAEGKPDLDFGDQGVCRSGISMYILECGITSVNIDPNDVIISLWYSKTKNIFMTQYRWDGSLNTDFNLTGTFVQHNYRCSVFNKPVYTRYDNGRFVVAGVKTVNNVYQPFLSFYNADGTLSTIGEIQYSRDVVGYPQVIAVGEDGLLYIVSTDLTEQSSSVYILRLLADGSIDPSYGQSGRKEVIVPETTIQVITSLVLTEDRIYISGYGEKENRVNFTLSLSLEGDLDKSFGEEGILLNNVKEYNHVCQIALNKTTHELFLCGYAWDSGASPSLFAFKYKKAGITNNLYKSAKNDKPLTIYPNPCSQQLHVQLSSSTDNILYLLNSKGQVVHHQAVSSGEEQIDVSNFKPGNYFISTGPGGKATQVLIVSPN